MAAAAEGFVERSNRTDNENLFDKMRIKDAQERKYQLRGNFYHS
jgi:hypothetical protein